MGFRFRKSINLGGGLKVNLSKKGVGVSGGVKGLRVGTGPSGTRVTSSIPGTGISYEKRLGKKASRSEEISNAETKPVNENWKINKWIVSSFLTILAFLILIAASINEESIGPVVWIVSGFFLFLAYMSARYKGPKANKKSQ